MRTDVVVVGGGMGGLSVAYEASATTSVVVLEAEAQLGQHSTGRSAAVLTTTTGTATVRELATVSRELLLHPPDGFSEHPLVTPRAVLRIAGADHAGALERAAREWLGAEVLTTDDARRLVPRLRAEAVALAVLEADGLDIDVDGLLTAYRRGTRARGGEVWTGAPVSAIERTTDGWRLQAGGERIDASVVVNAAGAWADRVAALAHLAPAGLVPLRRTAFVVDAPDDATTWPLVMDLPETFYCKPEGGLLLGSPADETPTEPCDARPEELDVAIGIDRLQAALDLDVRSVRRAWAGLRTFAPDREPVIGPHADDPTFVWCAGQGGYGIKIAPALARRVAADAVTAARAR